MSALVRDYGTGTCSHLQSTDEHCKGQYQQILVSSVTEHMQVPIFMEQSNSIRVNANIAVINLVATNFWYKSNGVILAAPFSRLARW